MEKEAVKIQEVIETAPYIPMEVATKQVLEIGTVQALLGIGAMILTIGIAWGTLRAAVKNIDGTLKTNIVPDLKNVRERFVIVEDRVETLWRDKYAPAGSPRKLNDRGKSILENSGIKEIVNEKQQKLLEMIQAKNLKTAYDAENEILSLMSDLRQHCPDIIDRLKEGAFKTGTDIDALLFVGGIYLRDQIFPKLGFSLDDLDNAKS